MSENDINLGNLESINFLLLIPFITILYFINNAKSDFEYSILGFGVKLDKILYIVGVILSFLTLILDKFGGPFNYFKTKKNKVDYKKLIFIMIYICILLLYNGIKKNIIRSIFLIVLLVLVIIFSFLENENIHFLNFEYLLYHWLIFSMIFLFYYLTKAKDYHYAKMYLALMLIISFVFIGVKPLIDIMLGEGKHHRWKYSNFKYFNKNISNEGNNENNLIEKNNKNVFNNLMNYIIINIMLLGVYVVVTYMLFEFKTNNNFMRFLNRIRPIDNRARVDKVNNNNVQ